MCSVSIIFVIAYNASARNSDNRATLIEGRGQLEMLYPWIGMLQLGVASDLR